jgi:hypothetical protein
MKKKPFLSMIAVYLLVSALYLVSPSEGAWAVPGQNPHRQSSPTRTPTPGMTGTPGATPRAPRETSATPVPMPQGNVSLPPATVTPLFLTLFPPTATPIVTWAAATWEVETEEAREVSTRQPFPTSTEGGHATPSRTALVEGTAVPISDGSGASPRGTLGTRTLLDCAVTGGGLVLLLIGLILVGGRR